MDHQKAPARERVLLFFLTKGENRRQLRSCQRSSECSLWRERKTIAILCGVALNDGNDLIPNALVIEKLEPCAQTEIILESELHELVGESNGQIGANAGLRFDAAGGFFFDEQGNAPW